MEQRARRIRLFQPLPDAKKGRDQGARLEAGNVFGSVKRPPSMLSKGDHQSSQADLSEIICTPPSNVPSVHIILINYIGPSTRLSFLDSEVFTDSNLGEAAGYRGESWSIHVVVDVEHSHLVNHSWASSLARGFYRIRFTPKIYLRLGWWEAFAVFRNKHVGCMVLKQEQYHNGKLWTKKPGLFFAMTTRSEAPPFGGLIYFFMRWTLMPKNIFIT
jgi:hypothetical protein